MKEDDAATCPLSQPGCYSRVGPPGGGQAPGPAALVRTESLSITSTQLHAAFTVSAGLKMHGSWHVMCAMSEQKSAQLG